MQTLETSLEGSGTSTTCYWFADAVVAQSSDLVRISQTNAEDCVFVFQYTVARGHHFPLSKWTLSEILSCNENAVNLELESTKGKLVVTHE